MSGIPSYDNGAVEGTGGGAGHNVHQSVQGEATFSVSVPAPPARNGVRFHNEKDIRIWRWTAHCRGASEDAVSVGRDEVNRPGSRKGREVHRKVRSQRK